MFFIPGSSVTPYRAIIYLGKCMKITLFKRADFFTRCGRLKVLSRRRDVATCLEGEGRGGNSYRCLHTRVFADRCLCTYSVNFVMRSQLSKSQQNMFVFTFSIALRKYRWLDKQQFSLTFLSYQPHFCIVVMFRTIRITLPE